MPITGTVEDLPGIVGKQDASHSSQRTTIKVNSAAERTSLCSNALTVLPPQLLAQLLLLHEVDSLSGASITIV